MVNGDDCLEVLWRIVTIAGVKVGFHYPSSRAEFTGRQLGPSTRAVNSGSGNRPLMCPIVSGTGSRGLCKQIYLVHQKVQLR